MIARALMHRPAVLFLDEPATGLDPQARLFVHERVAELRDFGVTVVLTTHDMDEAEKLCDRIGIVDHGKLLALDTADRLIRSLPGTTVCTVACRPTGGAAGTEELAGLMASALRQVSGVDRVERLSRPGAEPGGDEQFRLFTTEDSTAVLPAVVKVLADLRCEVRDFSVGRKSLEDVFLHLTGRELR